MLAHPLDGPRLKIERAKAQHEQLQLSIQRFRDGNHYRLIPHEEREGGRIRWTWDVIRLAPFPPDWPVLIGEILYQVRSALDHLAWQLASFKTAPDDPGDVTFPIFTSRTRFWRCNSTGRYRQSSGAWALARMPGDVRLLILRVQPYKRGNGAPQHPLSMLHALSNHDKHQALHIAAAAPARHRLQVNSIEGAKIGTLAVANAQPFDRGAKGVLALTVDMTAPKAYIDVNPQVVFEEVFGAGSPSPVVGLPIAETLRGILNYVVEEVANPLAAYYELRGI